MDAEKKGNFPTFAEQDFIAGILKNSLLVFCTFMIEHNCVRPYKLCSNHQRKGGIGDLWEGGASNSSLGEMDTTAKKQFEEQFAHTQDI